MTLEQLRIFVAVAEREHMTEAARALNLTQSATSAAVAALEERYRTKLFDRVGRGIRLTEAGRLFLVEARAVLARAAAAEAALADLAGLRTGSLAIAASQTVGNYFLPPLLAAFRSRYPGIAISLSIANTEAVAATIRDSRAGLGFIEGEIDDPVLAASPVADDELVVLVACDDPAARAGGPESEVEAGASVPSRWVARERGSGTRAVFDAALASLGTAPSGRAIVLELPSNEAVLSAVEAGAGAAVMSRLVAATHLAAGSVAALPMALPARRFYALQRRDHLPTRAEIALLTLLRAERADTRDPS